MARVSQAISSVYVPSVINRFSFGQGVVIYFIMQLLLKKSSKKSNLIYSEAGRSAFCHLVYFVNRYRNHSADGHFEYPIFLYVLTPEGDIRRVPRNQVLGVSCFLFVFSCVFFFFFFFLVSFCAMLVVLVVSERRASASLIMLSAQQGSHWYHF